MTKDKIQAALDALDKIIFDHLRDDQIDKCVTIIRAAISSAPKAESETVDLDALKEKMISDFEEEKEIELGHVYAVGLCDGVDYLAQNYNITRKTK